MLVYLFFTPARPFVWHEAARHCKANNKHHQMAQSKIEFCNYLNYLFARVHYQIVIMPNAFFVSRAGLVRDGSENSMHALFSLLKHD